MHPLIQPIPTQHTPESLVEQLRGERGVMLLRSALFESSTARYSFIVARPFLTFRSFGSHGELTNHSTNTSQPQFGNPWSILDSLMARYELLDEVDLPCPLGGCFGYWGYDLKNFVEPRLPRRAINDLELPDCNVGFYDSLVVFDHHLSKTWIISTGLDADASRTEQRARMQLDWWTALLVTTSDTNQLKRQHTTQDFSLTPGFSRGKIPAHTPETVLIVSPPPPTSTLTRDEFIARVQQIQRYIRAGDIYQVNLAQRLSAECHVTGWEFFQRLNEVSPAPFSAYIDCGDFQLASSSPELFLRLSGPHILTRPIKGTRPRSADAMRDAQLTYELQTSAKEMSELVMITDLLRNDLGRVCEYGSVQVPELVRLERYPQVQHLVSTVEGRLRKDVTHFAAFQSCFPGGSITGAPKIRAMEIIDELEPVARGPYTGALGYLGFNRESQLSIAIRTAVCREGRAWFHAGAGIVADSIPAAEYDETLAKAAGFLTALRFGQSRVKSNYLAED
ncbi:MAG TPA: aminodeoxychorismate synthase component I [Verrucomicrobiae bacterium]|jgi:para-aminobenzoate synthetase component 1|nr:aminodeoxychorismate synthase component I [Verrucomicrobiae bacterium]